MTVAKDKVIDDYKLILWRYFNKKKNIKRMF